MTDVAGQVGCNSLAAVAMAVNNVADRALEERSIMYCKSSVAKYSIRTDKVDLESFQSLGVG